MDTTNCLDSTNYFFQFIVAFSATTIGVLLALFLQKWHEKCKESKEAESIKSKLKKELINIQKIMFSTHQAKKSELLLSPIKMPIFQGFVTSLKISLLDRYVWYNDLLSLYKYLDTYNAWHDLKTDKSFGNNLQIEKYNNSYLQVDKSLLEIEKIVLGLANVEKSKRSTEENNIVLGFENLKEEHSCQLSKCTSKEKKNVNGLINCMITKISISNGDDLFDNTKQG